MEKFLSLDSSAGSGKTFALSIRYICILYLGASVAEILAITFTKKACKEMSDKILENLDLILNTQDTTVLDTIVKDTNLSKSHIKQNQPNIKQKFLNEENSIMTLDAFCNCILKEFSFEAGIGGAYEINNYLLNDEFKNYFYSKLYKDNTHEHLAQYKELLRLFSYKPNYVLDKLLPELRSDNLSKLKSLDDKKLDEYAQSLSSLIIVFKDIIESCDELSNYAFRSVDYNNIQEFIARSKNWISKDNALEYNYYKKIPQEKQALTQEVFLKLKQAYKNYIICLNNKKSNALAKTIKFYNQVRNEFVRKTKVLCFDDVVCFVADLLLTDGNNTQYDLISNEFIYFRLDFNIKHILIDEFQDTSIKQYFILQPLIENIVAGDGASDNKTFFYVGDCKQSIYGFRGGFEALFRYVSGEKFTHIQTNKLEYSYRSSPNVVSFINNAFGNIDNYKYSVQKIAKTKYRNNYVQIINFNNNASDNSELFENIVQKVQELQKLNINDIVILASKNDILNDISNMLDTHNISYSYTKKTKLIDTNSVSAIINAIAYLHLYSQINTDILTAQELDKKTSKFKIYKTKFNYFVSSDSLLDDICINKNDDDIKKFSLAELILSLSNNYNILDTYVMQLLHISYKYKNISEFVYKINELDESITIAKTKKNSVILSTIHSSKGLEFESVIVVDNLSKIKTRTNNQVFLKFYDKLYVKYLYRSSSGLEAVDENYKQTKEQENMRGVKNQINKTYVALSRARESLFIYKRDDDNSDFEFINNDMIDESNNTLTSVAQNKKQISSKDECRKIKPIIVKVALQNDYSNKNQTTKRADTGTNADKGTSTDANADIDTDTQQTNTKSKKQKEQAQEIEQTQAKKFGKAVHYGLECLRDFDNSCIDYAICKIDKFKLDNSSINEIKTLMSLLINDNEFIKLTQNGKKYFEQEYIFEGERKIIDLLIIKDNECVVIDYKTSNENVDVEHNTKQVKQYCEFVQTNTKKTTTGFLVHLNKNKIFIRQV